MALLAPFNLQRWLAEHRETLKPPVGNKLLYQDAELIVMAVGGPNSRRDFHHDPGEEFFHQIEGDIVLKTLQDGRIVDIPIRAGDVFLLPAEMPHSPRRPAGTIGLVVERRRAPTELDGFSWYCEHCGHRLHMVRIEVANIETELPAVFDAFYSNLEQRTCTACGTVMQPPA